MTKQIAKIKEDGQRIIEFDATSLEYRDDLDEYSSYGIFDQHTMGQLSYDIADCTESLTEAEGARSYPARTPVSLFSSPSLTEYHIHVDIILLSPLACGL